MSFFAGCKPSEHRFSDDDLRSIRETVDALSKLIRDAESQAAHQTAWEFSQAKAVLQKILVKGKVLITRGVDNEQRYSNDE